MTLIEASVIDEGFFEFIRVITWYIAKSGNRYSTEKSPLGTVIFLNLKIFSCPLLLFIIITIANKFFSWAPVRKLSALNFRTTTEICRRNEMTHIKATERSCSDRKLKWIGFETSLLLARNGFYTYATVRNLPNDFNIIFGSSPTIVDSFVYQWNSWKLFLLSYTV